HPTAFSAASVGRSAGLDCVDVLTPLRLPLGRVERSLDFDEKLIVVGDAGCYQSGLDRPASGTDVSLTRSSAIVARIINRTWLKARRRLRPPVAQPAGQLLAGQHRLGAATGAPRGRMDEPERA